MATRKQKLLERIYQLPGGTFWAFCVKQAWAAIFGGLLLGAIILTKYVDLPLLSRYDWLFLWALFIQAVLLLTKLEKPHEVLTIFVFHLVGLGMELFKTSSLIGSWTYPGDAVFMVGNVPLFSGFMYAAIGSYIARSWRVMELEFIHYPKRLYTVLLALAIYVNFFSHHFAVDIRIALFAATIWLYRKTWVHYRINGKWHRMPLLIGFGLIAFVIWFAENVATWTKVWLYPNQINGWHLVGIDKIGSWLLLMIISFILIDLLHYFRQRRTTKHVVTW